MLWRLILALVVAASAAGTSMLALPVWHSPSFPDDTKAWPTRLSQGVELPAGETFRDVEYYPDGVNRKYAEGVTTDGGLTYSWFHTNGNLSETKHLSALVDGKRTLLRHSLFERNGVSQILDQEYYASGVLKKLVRKITDSISFRWYYYDTGEVKLFQNFEYMPKTGWVKRNADTYRKDGSIEEHYQRVDSSTWEIQQYDLENKRKLVKGVGAWGYKYFETHYQADGITVRRKVDQNNIGTEVWTYYPDSNVAKEYRKYSGTTTDGTLYVNQFDQAGVKTLEQVWLYSNVKKAYTPAWVIVYQGGIAKFRLFFYLDSFAVKEIHQYLTDKHFAGDRMLYELRPDGSISSEKRLDPSNKVLSSRDFTRENQAELNFKLDPAWYAFYQSEIPPQVVTYDPSDR